MKMRAEDFETLKLMVRPLDTAERRARYLSGDFPRAEFVRNIDKRYRWDLLFAAGGRFAQGNFMSHLYTYLNDDHIDTALKKLIPDLSSTD